MPQIAHTTQGAHPVKWAQSIITGILLLGSPTIGVAVDCDNAYTKMERAICMDPRLLEVERRLVSLADEALGTGQIDRAQSKWLLDSLARSCRRSPHIAQCLLSVAERKIEWLASVTGSEAADVGSDPQTLMGADL